MCYGRDLGKLQKSRMQNLIWNLCEFFEDIAWRFLINKKEHYEVCQNAFKFINIHSIFSLQCRNCVTDVTLCCYGRDTVWIEMLKYIIEHCNCIKLIIKWYAYYAGFENDMLLFTNCKSCSKLKAGEGLNQANPTVHIVQVTQHQCLKGICISLFY